VTVGRRLLALGWVIAAFAPGVASARLLPHGPPATLAGTTCEDKEADKGPSQWHWEILPQGLIYRSYLAGVKEPRMYLGIVGVVNEAWFVDMTVGGRFGLVRYGNGSEISPEGFQFDIETAAMGRLDVRQDVDLSSGDLRIGGVLSHRMGDARVKLGYYHLSSHVGDEYLIAHPGFDRINYSREALVLGFEYFITSAVMPYVEVEWGTRVDGGSEPWEFQLGVDVSPAHGGLAPFFAVNGYLRQEVDFSGNFVMQAGMQYRRAWGQRIRAGGQYLTGTDPQFSFFQNSETQAGIGLWYDF
jgi:hypothetical protein